MVRSCGIKGGRFWSVGGGRPGGGGGSRGVSQMERNCNRPNQNLSLLQDSAMESNLKLVYFYIIIIIIIYK